MTTLFVLLVVYQLKHFLADYPLQNGYMLKKFEPGWKFLGPLVSHCMVHAVMTLWIVAGYLWYKNGFTQFNVLPAYELALLDFVIHFTMDRIKAGPKYLGRYKPLTAKEYGELKRQEAVLSQSLAEDSGPDNMCRVHKGITEVISKFKSNTYFWWSLGLDQMVHHLTHYYIIWTLVS